jgi:sugar phosphate isomerase/epimerase
MAAVSGTYNMIHPNRAVREDGLRRLETLAGACAALGTSAITLCTGTRDPENMWRRHPDNDLPDAWRDLLEAMTAAAAIAERHGVTLGIEPEVANVVDSARKARRLLDEIGSPRLKIVFDGANIFHAGELARQHELLDEAIDLLAADLAMAHAKDLDRDGEAGHLAAGNGLLDYGYYLARLQRAGFTGPLILHSLTEAGTPAALAFVREKLAGTS